MSLVKKIFNWRVFKWAMLAGLFLGICFIIFAIIFFMRATKDMPSTEFVQNYAPPVMTRVHAGDGKLIMEYAEQHRIFVPIESIPDKVQHAFVAAEDQRFYSHNGFDGRGFARAMVANVGHKLKGRRLEGGSTITQQVAKNMLVGNDRTVTRKLREILTAQRIEKVLDKDHVLELYLNEIYLGDRSYGVAAAALNYFDRSLEELSLSQIAYLAALPKAPNNYRIDSEPERAIARRNYVLARMVEDGYVTQEEADLAKEEELENVVRMSGEKFLAAGYFVEEARRKIATMYGEEELYQGGLSIRTTLDTNLQLIGRRALRNGLEAYDKRYGYRGPLAQFDDFNDWKTRLDAIEPPKDIEDWRVALVMKVDDERAEINFAKDKDMDERPEPGEISLKGVSWAAPIIENKRGNDPKKVSDVLGAGDVILVAAVDGESNKFSLEQVPDVNGGIIAMDPHTGRILTLVGGYSFQQNQFNRATQAVRQPGSSFKPFVYAAALDNGYTPASQVLDAPFVIKREDENCVENELGVLELRDSSEDGQNVPEGNNDLATKDECERFYKPGNFAEGRFYGMSTLRLGLELSRNVMTVRLANDIGMAEIMRYGSQFKIYDDPQPELGWVLGAGETSMIKLASAYSMLINGGKDVQPFILDRVQDGTGKTVYVHANEVCEVCAVEEWDGSSPPELVDDREQIVDPVTAYQITYMLQGVVENGTGATIRSLDRPLGGKTGTTNDFKDAWFMGFSPDLVVGVYVGYDTPRSLNNEAGGKAAAPIFKEFMQHALADTTKVPFRIPEGISFAPINRKSGEPSYIGAPEYVLEAFRPGTEPKIGEIGSTIRVGSGSDFFVSSVEVNGNDSAGTDGLETVDDTAENRDNAPTIPVSANTPDVEEDDELEDGLY